jgi:hypothetical protein
MTGTAVEVSSVREIPAMPTRASASRGGWRCSRSSWPITAVAAAGGDSMLGATPEATVTLSRNTGGISSSTAPDSGSAGTSIGAETSPAGPVATIRKGTGGSGKIRNRPSRSVVTEMVWPTTET